MKEGLELDKLIAIEVMGCNETPSIWFKDYDKEKKYWCVCGSPASEEVNLIEFVDGEWQQYYFSPSTNILNAWDVVEQVEEEIGDIELCSVCDEKPYMLKIYKTDDKSVHAQAKTAPLAICLAALKAYGIQ